MPVITKAVEKRSRPRPSRAITLVALSLMLIACSSPSMGPVSAPEDQSNGESIPTPDTTVVIRAETEAPQGDAIAYEPTGAANTADARGTVALSKQRASGASNFRLPQAPPRFRAPRPPEDSIIAPPRHQERYPDADENNVKQVARHPVSTFAIDVDTAAYANARRQLNGGHLPRAESVRVEEFVNYFNYSYPKPRPDEGPFSITTELGPSPWNSDRKLMLIGLQGYDVERTDLPPANLVFLVDVSGSMNQPNKLGLLKSSLSMLTRGLRAQDRISIAVYAGAAGTVLEPTKGTDRNKIIQALNSLTAGGSTNGGAGIDLAYRLAEQNFRSDGINRVILATDGDFNVGPQSVDALRKLVEQKRTTGVSLTVLGFGQGNYNDALMQELAQKGNGNAAYIDNLNEARKVLVDEVGSTLQTIAKDVKIQVEFNPATVKEYRLIGYETRSLRREDFNNDRIDAGDIGAGHSVTALYELTLADSERPAVDELRYRTKAEQPKRSTQALGVNATGELSHVKLRYKEPNGKASKLITRVVDRNQVLEHVNETSDNYRFASAASAFAQLLRGSDYTGSYSYQDVLKLARKARGVDEFGYRHEFEQLLRTAAELAPLRSASGVTSGVTQGAPEHQAFSMRSRIQNQSKR